MAQKDNEVRAKRKQQIKDVALKLFAFKGYHSTSISSIAKEAGISKGLMYNYFESKEDLLADLVMGTFEETEQMMKELLTPELSPQQMIEALVWGFVEQVKQSFDHWKLLMALGFQSGILDEFKVEIATKAAQFFGQMSSIFEEMGAENPMLESMLFGSHLDGMFMHYLQGGEEYPIDEVAKGFIGKYVW